MANKMPVQKVSLHCPPLEEVAQVLQKGLGKYFSNVDVQVVDSPDLSKQPFYLASEGICGSPRITDVGGVPYLVPLVQKDKQYDLRKIASNCELPEALAIGPGAGPQHIIGQNSEMIANVKFGKDGQGDLINSHFCKIVGDGYEMTQKNYTECSLMTNLLLSEGKRGKVIQVQASRRTQSLNFFNSMQKLLSDHYGDKPVGIGGAFLLEKGKAKVHVMPDFSEVPLQSDEDVENWLKFFEVSAPVVSLGVFVSHDPGLDLRVDHFHCFSDHGEGGHFHYDTTPEDVSYLGYFNVAENIYRIDRPKETHNIGRD